MSLEQKALLPGSTTPEVNSSTIGYFLNHDSEFDVDSINYASTLELPVLKPYLKRIANQSKLVYIGSNESRELENKYRDQHAEIFKLFPQEFLDMIHNNRLERLRLSSRDPFEQGGAERHKLIYASYEDPNCPKARATRIRHGEFDRVKTGESILKILLKDDAPLIDCHSHPDGSLFSPADYHPMLTLTPVRNRLVRCVKGLIVVSKDHQLLALSTPNTPSFVGFKSSHEFIKEKKQKLMEEYEKKFLKSLMIDLKLERYLLMRSANLQLDLQKVLTELQNDNNLTEEEFSALGKRKATNSLKLVQELSDFYLQVATDLHHVFNFYQPAFFNQKLMALSKEMAVKLYLSTNMQTFNEVNF